MSPFVSDAGYHLMQTTFEKAIASNEAQRVTQIPFSSEKQGLKALQDLGWHLRRTK